MASRSPHQLFGNDKNATELFISLRWPTGPICPSCETQSKFYVLSDARLKCSACLYRFRLTSGSYLDSLYMPTNEIYNLVYLFSLGVPVFKSRKLLPVSMKTAHRAYRIFRENIYNQFNKTYHISHPGKLSEFKRWPIYSGNFVVGICEHEGVISTFPCSLQTALSVIPLSDDTERVGDLHYTDHWNALSWFKIKNDFVSVDKRNVLSGKKNLRHGGSIDQFWFYLKSFLNKHPAINKKYFPHYLKEAEFRFNHKNDDLFRELAALLSSSRKK